MIKKTVEFEIKYQEAAKNADELGKIVQKQDKEISKLQGTIDKNFDDIAKSSKSTAKGIKGIGTALKAAGIGLAIAAFAKLTEVFNQNQKVTDFFSATFETLSIAFNDFFKFLDKNISTASGFIDKIFGNEVVQKIAEVSRLIGVELVTRIKNLIQGIGGLGSAVAKVFSGDFLGAYETATSAVNNLGDALLGNVQETAQMDKAISDVTSKISNYVKSTIDAAKSTVELNKQAEVAAVINQGLIEKYDRQAEQQRQIRDDESKTIEERIAANNKLGEVLEEQQKLMLENVDITIRAAQAEYNKNKNQENRIALLEAQNEREAVLAQIEGFRSEQLINKISLDKEALELQKEAIKTEDERIAKIAELTNFEILTAVEKLQRDRDNALAELDLLEATEAEKQKIRDHYAEEEEKLTKLTTENKLDLASNAMGNLAAIFGEESKAGKAAAIAQTTIETYKGATSAFASLSGIPIVGPVLGGIAAAAAVAAGIANVKKINSIGPAVSGGGGSAPSAPQAPSFNIVGAAPENQLAQAIGEKEDKPIKAFVVSNEVTNAQALERNIIQGASIG